VEHSPVNHRRSSEPLPEDGHNADNRQHTSDSGVYRCGSGSIPHENNNNAAEPRDDVDSDRHNSISIIDIISLPEGSRIPVTLVVLIAIALAFAAKRQGTKT
jgi:hypothetical protein